MKTNSKIYIAVKRNIQRFPQNFRFQLSENEKNELVTNCNRFNSLKHSTSLPYAFTEFGVSMLSVVLKSDIAIEISIKIIELKKFYLSHDRFLIIDDKEVYHIGTSLKYLDKKWFAFSKMDINYLYTIKGFEIE